VKRMNMRLVSVALLLMVVISIALPASAMALTGQERRALWNKYSYRYGDGRMGWLSTPNFKNGGFEEGGLSYWEIYGTNINAHEYLSRTTSAHGGEYVCALGWESGSNAGDFCGVRQEVNLTNATGISFWTRVTGVDDYNPEESTATIQVFVDSDKVYERTFTDISTGDWVEEITASDIEYRGKHTVLINFIVYGCGCTIQVDDIKLLGPGF
jgi:hypothetical protein